MTRNSINGLLATLSNKAKSAAIVTGSTLAVSPAFAFAAGDFDGVEVIAKVVTYTAVGVSMVGAFILGRWTLKALGVIGK
ncbi:hypothetical protein [uncultured Stenotrophomonas sp.]|uniref:hypothetical protein n=1 Tax=uncultured Stenotrophomonas sp. TaxID=165438 RepID=UPI0025F8CCBA|nr:hypothetical protein [uncultured Stenotrophomonas sp.]